MNVVLWVIAIALAAAFLLAGVFKMAQPKEKLVASGLAWAEDFSPGVVKLIGVLEFLAGVGLVLPALLGIATVFVPLAALGLVLIMIGAVITHIRRGNETQMVIANVVLLLLAAIVAWGRFGPYSFDS